MGRWTRPAQRSSAGSRRDAEAQVETAGVEPAQMERALSEVAQPSGRVTRRDGAEAFADGAEGAASLDLSQLPRVADPDELAADCGDVFGQTLVFAGADHARLVDQQHGATREGLAVVEGGEQAGGVQRAHAGLLFERTGGQVAGRGAQNRVPRGHKGIDSHAQRVGLARAGARLHVSRSQPRARQLPYQRHLPGSQGRVRGERAGDGPARDDGHAPMVVLGHGCEQGLLGGRRVRVEYRSSSRRSGRVSGSWSPRPPRAPDSPWWSTLAHCSMASRRDRPGRLLTPATAARLVWRGPLG
jgi:hypothetical protein